MYTDGERERAANKLTPFGFNKPTNRTETKQTNWC